MPDPDFRSLCAELARIEEMLETGSPSLGNQGQALDGYAALANFRDIARRARAALSQPAPEPPKADLTPKHHDLSPCELLALDWRPALDIKILRSNGEYSELYGYHEARFSIGADEVGRFLITDTALQMLRLSQPAPEPLTHKQMPTPESKPLWRVMNAAYQTTEGYSDTANRQGYAAELRAIADWIRQRHPLTPDSQTYLGANVVAAELLAEADRAEGTGVTAPTPTAR